jgi:hypothetical protein
LHTADRKTRLPAGDGFGGGGIYRHQRGPIHGRIDELENMRAIVSAHDARADGRGEDIGDRLLQMGQPIARATGFAGHARHAVIIDRPGRL